MQSISVPRLLSKSEVMLKSFSLRFSIHIWLKDQNYLLIWISTRLAEKGFQGHGFDILHTKKLSYYPHFCGSFCSSYVWMWEKNINERLFMEE